METNSRVARRLRCLRLGINANFTIVCSDREWQVDKGILVAESEYFEKLCIGGFGEASEARVEFPDEQPEVIDQLLVYLYTSKYDDLAVLPISEERKSYSGFPPQLVPHKRQADENDSATGDSIPPENEDQINWTTAGASQEPRLGQASQLDVTRVLKFGILVTQCATMMDLTELAETAVQVFLRHETYWMRSDFADVLHTVFSSTASDDRQLRVPVLMRCLENQTILDKYPAIVHVLEQHEPVAWRWSVAVKVESSVTIEDLRKELQAVKQAKGNDGYKARCKARSQTEQIKSLERKNQELKNDMAEQDANLAGRIQELKNDFDDLAGMSIQIVCPKRRVTTSFEVTTMRNTAGKLVYMCPQLHEFVSGHRS